MRRFGLVLFALGALASCGREPGAGRAQTPDGRTDSGASATACEASVKLRVRANELYLEGKLGRLVRILDEADKLCPATAPGAWKVQVEGLAALGRYADALALAGRMDTSREASTAAHVAAEKARADAQAFGAPTNDPAAEKRAAQLFQEGLDLEKVDAKLAGERFLDAWKARHPNGEALLHAGLAAKSLGAGVEAQRLFDRALAEIERVSGATAKVDVPNGLDAKAAVAWRPDGEAVAVGHGARVVLLGGPTLEERVRFEGHRERVDSIAFSRDGKRLVSGSADHTMRVWDATTGALQHEFTEFGEDVGGVAFSPDGTRVAAVSDDGWLQVFDTTTSQPVLRRSAGQPLFSLAFSPTGAAIATGGLDGSVRLYSVPKGEVVATLAGHKGGVFALAFSADGKRLASGSQDGTARVWDVAAKRATRTLAGYASGLALSRDGKLVALGAADHTVALFDADLGIARGTLRGHAGQVTALAFAPDGQRLLSCADDRAALLWDVAQKKTLVAVEGHGSPLVAVAFDAAGSRIATVSRDRRSVVFGAGAAGLVAHEIRPDVAPALAIAPDGKTVATATSERSVELWDAETGKTAATLASHDAAVTALAFDTSGKLVASASADKTVDLSDVAKGALVQRLERHRGAVLAVAFSPDAKRIATGGADFDVVLWDASKRTPLLTLEHGYQYDVTSVAFSPDGGRLASVARGDTLWIWDVATGKSLFTIAGPAGSARAVAFARDGKAVATAAADGAVRVYSALNGKYLQRLAGSGAAVTSVAFSARRDLLAAASTDGSIFLWDPTSGALVATIRAVAGSRGAYVVSSDGAFEPLGELPPDLAPVCRVGPRSYPFALCAERMTAPGLLKKILAGDASYLSP